LLEAYLKEKDNKGKGIARFHTSKITELWKDVEKMSCHHTQKCLLDTPTFLAVPEHIKDSECRIVETNFQRRSTVR